MMLIVEHDVIEVFVNCFRQLIFHFTSIHSLQYELARANGLMEARAARELHTFVWGVSELAGMCAQHKPLMSELLVNRETFELQSKKRPTEWHKKIKSICDGNGLTQAKC